MTGFKPMVQIKGLNPDKKINCESIAEPADEVYMRGFNARRFGIFVAGAVLLGLLGGIYRLYPNFSEPDEVSAFAAWLQLLSNVILAALTAAYVMITRGQYVAATAPHVIVYVKHDESRPSLLQIVIENVGRGLARDINFKLSRSAPHRLFDKTGSEPKPMDCGPLIDGIPALGPGDTRKIIWGSFEALQNTLGRESILVTCEFSDGTKRLPPIFCPLEVNSFDATDAVDSDGARQCAQELRKIAKTLAQKK